MVISILEYHNRFHVKYMHKSIYRITDTLLRAYLTQYNMIFSHVNRYTCPFKVGFTEIYLLN